jgi:hypothetical protein
MAFTSTTLKAALESYLQTTETDFVANENNIILQTEDRISKAVILPAARNYAPINLTSGSTVADLPSDFLAPFEVRISDSNTFTPCDYVDVSLIREAFPNPLMVGVPRWYSMFSSEQLIFGPTPTTGLTAWVHYFYKPASITVAGTSWLGTHAENCLLYGCLSEAYLFLKGEADLQALYETKFQAALADLRKLGEGLDMGDAYRMGEIRAPRGSTGAPVSG